MKKIIPDDIASYINMTCDMDERNKNVIYEDDLFICVKDIKHIDDEMYHYTAWCKEDVRSLIELERKHINYLKNIRTAMYYKFNLTDENTGNFIHFPPSFWLLHIHFVPKTHTLTLSSEALSELYFINDIIKLLKLNEDIYRTRVKIAKL